jgi:hypothetical protein
MTKYVGILDDGRTVRASLTFDAGLLQRLMLRQNGVV